MKPTTRNAARAAILGSGLLLVALGAFAKTPINQEHRLDPQGRLEIENIKGRIDVQTWDRPLVQLRGHLGEGVEKLEVDGDSRRLSIKVKYPNQGRLGFLSGDNSEPSELRLMVPLRAELDIDGVSADIDVQGTAARALSIDSVSGNVAVVGAPGEVGIDSVSGDMRLTINSADVDLESVSGDIDLRGRLGGRVQVATVSGDVDVRAHESRIRELEGESVSGDMAFATGLSSGGSISAESVSGDISLRLPPDLSADVSGESFSGDLSAPGAEIERPRHGPGASFQHRYGAGAGEIRMETFSGDAELRLD